MHVLIADKFPASGITALLEMGCQVASNPEFKGEALEKALRELKPDVLVVRSTKVTAPMLEAGSLSLVIRAGAGVNTIDVATASRLGIYVTNCPGKNAIAVAELTMGLLLSMDRRIPDNVIDLRAGKWNKKEYVKAAGLYGRILGIIGLGNIGQEVARRARAFGMHVVAWSRSLSDETAMALGVERAATPIDVARQADAVTVHLALTPETEGIIDSEFFMAMRPGAFFINTSRGEMIDEEALARAMKEKPLRAGLDVYAIEPGAGDTEFADPIGGLPSLYGTHHIGASTDQSQAAIAEETVRIVRTYCETGKVLNCVNLARSGAAKCLLTVRHRDQVGVLAHVLGEIRAAKINVQEMENVIFDGAEAACARLQLNKEPESALLERIRSGNPDVLALTVTCTET